MSAAHWLSDQLFGFGRAERAGEGVRARIIETVVLLLTFDFVWNWAQATQRISEVVRPLAFAVWFDLSFLFGPGAYVVAGLLTASSVAGYFRLFRSAYLIAFVLLVLQYSARYCIGEIPHSANLVGSAFLGLALGHRLFTPSLFQARFFLGLTYFLCGLGYTLASFSKLIATGLGWSSGTHLWVWIHSRDLHNVVVHGHNELNALQELALSNWWVATAFLTFGWVTEAVAWTVWIRRIRPFALWGIVGLHVGIYFTMGITFFHATLFLITLALPLEALSARIKRMLRTGEPAPQPPVVSSAG